MKIPLSYQTTEYDCCTTCYLNALNYLLEREEIDAELLKGIFLYTMDQYHNTDYGASGTSKVANLMVSSWIENYSRNHHFPLSTEMYYGSKVNAKMFETVLERGVIIARVWLGVEHYVLVTKIDREFVYLFDPYYVERIHDSDIIVVRDKIKQYNRKVTRERFFSSQKQDLSLGEVLKRECSVLYCTSH